MDAPSEAVGFPFDPAGLPSHWERFSRVSSEYPDNTAIVCTHQPPNLYGVPNIDLALEACSHQPYLRWTYRSLKTAVDRLVQGLQASGVTPGTPLFTFMHNMVEFPLAMWASHCIGCYFVPLNPRNLQNQDEVSHMMNTVTKTYPSKTIVTIAGNSDIADKLDALKLPFKPNKIIAAGDAEGWISFAEVMPELKCAPDSSSFKPSDNTILFTSGSTSLPKACLWEYPAVSVMCEERPAMKIVAGDANCLVVPNNHAIGCLAQVITHCVGAAVVYPGMSFTPKALLDTMRLERCTASIPACVMSSTDLVKHVALVPTMVYAILSINLNGKLPHLKSVFLGGAMVTEEVIRQCFTELGAEEVDHAYGMTEGVFFTAAAKEDPRGIVKGGKVSVGKPLPGTKARICGPNTKLPLPTNTIGELHYSGPFLAKGYLSKNSNDFYVGDDGRRWFNTGDQAMMDDDGDVFITGRYKEIIIRGGENISPTAVETALSRNSKTAPLNVQIVGAPDPIAGEVPVAVVEASLTPELQKELRNTILDHLGTAFVPDETVTLHNLDLTDYPRTMGGKIQKNKLAAIVVNFRKSRDQVAAKTSVNPQISASVKRIWSRAIGHEVDESTSISDFADSITVMKVRDNIAKETGRSISLADMAEGNTIASQIKLLETQFGDLQTHRPKVLSREGPPTSEDITGLPSIPKVFDSTKSYIEQTLREYDMVWKDVEDVIPAYDFGQTLAQTQIFDSWNIKFALLARGKNATQVRGAIETTLSNNRMAASFLLWNRQAFGSDVAFHVIVRQDKAVFDKCISYHGNVDSLEDVKDMLLKSTPRASVPGPLFRALTLEIKELDCAAVIVDFHHAILDASYGLTFLDDLDSALGGKSLDPHIDYKIWADSFYSLKTSLEARTAIAWHVDRLKGLADHGEALFPHPRVTNAEPNLEKNSVQHSFNAPGILSLRRKHRHITAPVIIKTAFVLFNLHRTGQSHALFANLEAARTRFPFIPKSLNALGHNYEATDVAGPTIQAVINFIELKTTETVLQLLGRMQRDQNNLTRFASAPLSGLIAELGEPDGPMILDVLKTQIFNWVPGMGTTGSNPYQNFEALDMVARPMIRFVLNTGLGGSDATTVFFHLRGSAFVHDELRRIATELEKLTQWLTNEANLDVPASEFGRALAH